MEVLGNGEAVGNIRMPPVKSCVEACDLRQSGMPCEDDANRGQIVELVERRQRSQPFKVIEHGICNDGRLLVVGTAVDNAMSDCRWQLPPGLLPKKEQGSFQRRGYRCHLGGSERGIDEGPPFTVSCQQARPGAYSVYLSLDAQFESIMSGNAE